MENKTKERFFETFNIPKKFYTTVNFGDLDNNYQEVCENTLEELFENYSWYLDEYIEDIKDFHGYEEKYPEITAEIVLELMKIITKKHCNFTIYYGAIDISSQVLLQCFGDYKDKVIYRDIRNLFNV